MADHLILTTIVLIWALLGLACSQTAEKITCAMVEPTTDTASADAGMKFTFTEREYTKNKALNIRLASVPTLQDLRISAFSYTNGQTGSGWRPAGRFVASYDYEVSSCGVGGANSLTKTGNMFWSVSGEWIPPADQGNGSYVVFFAAARHTDGKVYTGIQSHIVSRSSADDTPTRIGCDDIPDAYVETFPSPAQFSVHVNSYVYSPGQALYVTIGQVPGESVRTFTKLLLVAFDDMHQMIGKFEPIDKSSAIYTECSETASAIVHTDESMKMNVTVRWHPPPNNPGLVQFVAAVVDYVHDRRHTGLVSEKIHLTKDNQTIDKNNAPLDCDLATAENVNTSVPVPYQVHIRDYAGNALTQYDWKLPIIVHLSSYEGANFTNYLLRRFDQRGESKGQLMVTRMTPDSTSSYCGMEIRDTSRIRKLSRASWMWYADKNNYTESVRFIVAVQNMFERSTYVLASPWISGRAPSSAEVKCSYATPHAQLYEFPAKLYSNDSVYNKSGDAIEVTLRADYEFSDYMIRAFDQDGDPVGSLLPHPDSSSQEKTCDIAGDSIVGTNQAPSRSVTVLWVVPELMPRAVMFVAASTKNNVFTNVHSNWLNSTSNISRLLPCPELLPEEVGASSQFTFYVQTNGKEAVAYSRNKPVYVTVYSNVSNPIIYVRFLAFTVFGGLNPPDLTTSETYGKFSNHTDLGMRTTTGRCRNENDTATAQGAYYKFNVSVMWVAPDHMEEPVRFVALILDAAGRQHKFFSRWLISVESDPPMPECMDASPQAPVFPGPSPCMGVTAGAYYPNGTFGVIRSFNASSSVQVQLRCPDDSKFDYYKIRAFDTDGRPSGLFSTGGTSNARKCASANDTAVAATYGDRSTATAFWRPGGGVLPKAVRFYAAYTSTDIFRVFTGLWSDWIYLGVDAPDPDKNSTISSHFNVSCTDLYMARNTTKENGRPWLSVSAETGREAVLYDLYNPLLVSLRLPSPYKLLAYRIGARDSQGRPTGFFQPMFRYPAYNVDRTHGENCGRTGSTMVNTGAVYRQTVTVAWIPPNLMSSVTFYAAVIDDNTDLITNVISPEITPTLSTISPGFDCEETTLSTEPFSQNDWRGFELKAWIVGAHEDSRKLVAVYLSHKKPFTGFMLRAYDENNQPITEFLTNETASGVVRNPYHCSQSADAFLVKSMPAVHSVTVQFAAPTHARIIRFVASVMHDNLLSKGIVSPYVNMSKSALGQLGLGCDDVTPSVLTSPRSPTFGLGLKQIVHDPVKGSQTVTMLVLSGSSYTIKAYTIRAFDRGNNPSGRFHQKTSTLSVWTHQVAAEDYNDTLVSCDLYQDTLRNMGDWSRRYNMTFDWEAPNGVAEVIFVMTLIDSSNNVYRGVKSEWISLAQTCAPAMCAKWATQRRLCNTTGWWIDPSSSDYAIYTNKTEFLNGDIISVNVRADSQARKPIRGVLLRVYTDGHRPVGQFAAVFPEVAPASCQTQNDAAWNTTDNLNAGSIGANWHAPTSIGLDVSYVYFVASVYDGSSWQSAQRSSRIYRRSQIENQNSSRSGYHLWCNLTSIYTASISNRYKIKVPEYFEDDKPIEVEIDSYTTKEMLGFMIRAYTISGRPIGRFTYSRYSAIQPLLHSCNGPDDSFTNKTSNMYIYSRAAQWSNNGQSANAVVFVATVLDKDGKLHVGIRSNTVYLQGEISNSTLDHLSCANTSVMVDPPTDSKFYLDANATEFTVKQPLYVTIRTTGPRFNGFFMRAFSEQYQPIGVFSHSYVYSNYHGKGIRCSTHDADTITNSTMDNRYSQTVMWISPPAPPTMVIFVASVVDEHGRVTHAIRSKWIRLKGGPGPTVTPVPPHELFCSDTELHVKTDPPYPPFVIEPANGTYVETATSRHIQITSYGSTYIHWYFLRAFDRVGRTVGTFDTHTWSQSYGSSVNYINGDLVSCELPSDSIMSDMSASPRQSVIIKYTAPSRDTPDDVMFVAIVRDSAGVTYKAIQSKWITMDVTKTAGTTTKASSVITVTFLSFLSLLFFHQRS